MRRTALETLSHIASRLADTPPTDLIEEMMPRASTDAVTWVRRLPHWDEFRGQQPDQAIALARIISCRAMREFGLAISEDGRIVERYRDSPWPKPTPSYFQLTVAGDQVQVEYTGNYFPKLATDNFEFKAERNPLGESGFWHTFAQHDAVEVCGGPKAFAALYTEAMLAGREQEFMQQFEGKFPEQKKPQSKKAKKPRAVELPPILGEHTAAVVEQLTDEPPVSQERRGEPTVPVKQGMLF